MTLDFEALVGHLYIVGGRAISVPPPGSLVEVAPQKAARGRESETFFVLVLPSGDITAPTAFYEQMAKLAAEHYFGSTGSVTAALRSVFNTINQNLVEHNRSGRRHYEANMLCAVAHGDDLIVARVGSGVALMRQTGETRTFPENLNDDEALFGPPMGVHPVPDVKMTRFTIAAGSRLVLGDSNLAEVNREKISGALMAVDIGEVLVAYRQVIVKQATLLAVEFVLPDEPAPLPVREAESTVELTAKTSTSEMPEAKPRTESKRRRRSHGTGEAVGLQVKRGVGRAALGMASTLAFINRLLDHFFPRPDENERKWLSTPLASGIVVLVPVVVVVLVMVIWLGEAGPSEFEQCVREATSRAELARGISTTNITDTLNAWNLVLAQVATCESIRKDDAIIASLKSEGQKTIDSINMIQRREAKVIAPLPNATIQRIILQGSDIYAFDSANGFVYRVALSADGLSAVGAPQPIPSMRRGASINGYVMGDLVDIAFAQQENVVVAVDKQGVVVKCAPRFITSCEPQRLLATENWVDPIAMTVWQGRLYILDSNGNQIWRYDPSGGQYASAPREYFTGQGRPPLINAVDFGIDDSGRVYVLRSDGVLIKFYQGQPEDFGWAGFPENPPGANALFLSTNPIFPGLFVASRTNRTIYETTLSGTFTASYRVFDEDQFALLSSVAADPNQQLVYAASGNTILVFPK